MIRPIEQKDLEKCAELYARVFSSPPWNEPWTKDKALERLSCFFESKGFVGFIADNGEVASLVIGNIEPFHTGSAFYLRDMCTSTGLQSTGIGSRLIEALERDLALRKVSYIYLTTENKIKAAVFYLSKGFVHGGNWALW